MDSLLSLSCSDRAAFAVTSRLLSCLVTESLLKALFVPIDSQKAVGACVVLSSQASAAGVPLKTPYRPEDIFAIIPLCTPPVLKSGPGKEVGLVDPMDMLPWIYEVCDDPNPNPALKLDLPTAILSSLPLAYYDFTKDTSLSLSLDPLYLWKKFSASLSLDPCNEDAITQELRSSFLWQKHAYENCPPRPTLASSSIEWERALVEGHPTHPMHRARRTLPPIPALLPGQYDFYQPRVRFVSIPRTSLEIQGDFEKLIAPMREAAACNAKKPLEAQGNRVLLPVHELQVANLTQMFHDVVVLPKEFSVVTPAQASIRTVTLPCSPELTLKLAVGMKISSALRTISHFTAFLGPRFGAHVVPKLAIDPKVLVVENEVASVVYRHADPEVAKHCTALVREAYGGEGREKVIMAAALAEAGYGDEAGGEPAVVTVFGLDTTEKKWAFLERYVNLIFDAFLPPLLTNGVAFEAHGQNTLARFDASTGLLTGFVFRDFGGLRIYPPTLLASTGVDLYEHTLPTHCIIVPDIHDAYKRLYHTLIHSHLHRLVRVLGFHHNGRGWALVKGALEERVPRGCGLWDAWMGEGRETVMGKCLMRMKLEGLYRDAVYAEVPNLIHYRGVA